MIVLFTLQIHTRAKHIIPLKSIVLLSEPALGSKDCGLRVLGRRLWYNGNARIVFLPEKDWMTDFFSWNFLSNQLDRSSSYNVWQSPIFMVDPALDSLDSERLNAVFDVITAFFPTDLSAVYCRHPLSELLSG